jgi:hypothetical protein
MSAQACEVDTPSKQEHLADLLAARKAHSRGVHNAENRWQDYLYQVALYTNGLSAGEHIRDYLTHAEAARHSRTDLAAAVEIARQQCLTVGLVNP